MEFNLWYHSLTLGNYNASNLIGFIFRVNSLLSQSLTASDALAVLFLLYSLIPLMTSERASISFHFGKALIVQGEKTLV